MITSRLDVIKRISDLAHARLPQELHGRLERGTALVLHEMIQPCDDGTYRVMNSTGTKFYSVNGTCDCDDYPRAPEGLCKHRLSAMIYRRVEGLLSQAEDEASLSAVAPETPQGADAPEAILEGNTGIPAALATHIIYLHGKPFVRYSGLLDLAHQRGLLSLKAKFISVTTELALAEAEAVFENGRTFCECADASPTNVGASVRHAFARMALTRSKARCLRDALNLGGLCSVEELME